jgi:hypothetical protein
MKQRMQILALFVLIITLIVSCSFFLPADDQPQESDSKKQSVFGKSQVIDIVWDALEPNTSSHNRLNWQVVQAELVTGGSVVEHFEGEPAPGCWSGPKPPENQEIDPINEYWYVLMAPLPATPDPFYGTSSPTAPPLIPEPFLKQAHFLIDPNTGDILARKLICVVY